MEDKLIRFETELNLARAELYELKAGLNYPENFYVTEVDIENYMKIYKIDSHDDLQHMVNFYIKQAFHRLTT